MTATDETVDQDQPLVLFHFIGTLVTALLAGAAIGVTARVGALALLIAVAVVQAVVALAVLWSFEIPGRKGSLVLVALAAGGADVAVSVWPHSRLGTVLAVLGLAVPLLVAHQLLRGAARVRVVESLAGTAIAVLAVVALPAFVQLRHEFPSDKTGGEVVFAVVLAVTAALVVGYLVDLVVAVPRFDADVPRGLIGVVVAALVAALVGYLTLHRIDDFDGARGLFAGASLGVLVALFAVGVSFAEASTPSRDSAFGRRLRPVLGALLPLAFAAPIAFLLCLAIRV